MTQPQQTMDLETLNTVLDISRRMAEERSLPPLLQYAMDQAIKLVKAERGHLVMVKGDGTLDFRVSVGQHETPGSADQVSTSILNAVINSRKPLVLRDAGLDPTFSMAKSVMMLKLRSVMCVPLIARGQCIGAIYVENRSAQGRFNEANLPPLSLFANQAAVAIENAALNDELEGRIAARTHELAEAKSAMEESWHQAVEANRLRTVWFGNVAHDMRAPLTITLGAVELMKEGEFGPLTPDQKEWLERAFDATQRALNLTNDVFDLTKIEFGGMRMYKEAVNPVAFFASVFRLAEGLPWPDEVKLALDVPENLPPITMDPSRIQQVLLNLVSNALRFTDRGVVTIYAQHLPEKNALLFGVRDTGKGIDSSNKDKLFKRFQQFAKDPERRRSGTGLGLAISYELVEMHGGEIWVESELDKGSDFKFWLPLEPQSAT